MSVQLWTHQLLEVTKVNPPTYAVASDLADLFDLYLDNPQVSSLQNDIQDNNVDFEATVDAADFFEGDWPGFVELTKSYLRFCQSVEPYNLARSFDLYGQFFADLQAAFANGNRGAVLHLVVVQTCRQTLPVAIRLDAETQSAGMRAEYISSVLLKIFNSIRAEKSTGPGDQISRNASYETRQQVAVTSRKAVILFVANSLCRLYFNLRTPSSCANVFSNIHTAKVKFAGFSQAEKVEYRYYLGRFYLMKNQLVSAYKHLRYSFDNCLATSGRNRQLILHYLIPASLLLGKLPSLYLLDSSGLDPVYGPLVQAVRRCDYTSYMAYLEEEPRRSWLLRRGLYVALRYRVEVLFHRNVLYQTWKANDRKNVLSYQAITTAFALSKTGHPDELLHRQDTEFMLLESVLASLISQRLVRANIFSRSSMLRLRDVNPIPKLVEVHDIKESTVLEADEQWMRD